MKPGQLTPIPVTKHGWLDYGDNNVFIIKPTMDGNGAQFQFDGVSCRQNEITGLVLASWVTNNKWFKSDYWYTHIRRVSDGIIKVDKIKDKESIYHGKHDDKILTSQQFADIVKAEILANTGWKAEDVVVEADSKIYEAFKWFEYKGKPHLFTWKNCD